MTERLLFESLRVRSGCRLFSENRGVSLEDEIHDREASEGCYSGVQRTGRFIQIAPSSAASIRNHAALRSVNRPRELGQLMEIFLNYRIVDSVYAVNEISKQMARHLGRARVFRDVDSLALGRLYARRIRRALEECDTMVSVIGSYWLDARDERGLRRIDDDRDWVRMELVTAFARGIPVVPVLLDDTSLPSPDQLPADIRALSQSQYWHIRYRTVEEDVRGLLRHLAPGADIRPDGPDRAAQQGPQNNQINVAKDGSVVHANQNGTQNIWLGGHHRR
ncbi:toll/interleukin-1 receptor domain-containing protein [Nocardia sp. NPDC051900]|uniref:toll/interleukin-1 receptor domain-containing protein n=1 Tax=Nocardia sp. NPDC051900 TaxID=3364326 RepID=UPI00378E4F8C